MFFSICNKHFSVSSSSNLDHGFLWKGLGFFDVAQKKIKKKENSSIWYRTFLTYVILHDAVTTRFNWWLWQWKYITFSLILSVWAERQLMCVETEAAPSLPCSRQLLISKVKFSILLRITSAKALTNPTNNPENLSIFFLSHHFYQHILKQKTIAPDLNNHGSSAKIGKKYFLECL